MRKLQTTDLFGLLRLATKLGIKEDIKAIAKRSNNAKDVWDNGFDLLFGIAERIISVNGENGIYEFLSPILGMPAEEIKVTDPVVMLDKLLEVADVEGWKSFFKRAASLMMK